MDMKFIFRLCIHEEILHRPCILKKELPLADNRVIENKPSCKEKKTFLYRRKK